MPVSLDNTVAGASANTYVTLAEADTYVETHVLDDDKRGDWISNDADYKSRLLILACQQIDQYMEWVGYKTIETQRLEWPRNDAYDSYGYWLDSTKIPYQVKEAQIELALWLKDNNGAKKESNTNAQFDSIRVGSISINFNEKAAGSIDRYLPDHVVAMLAPVGEYAKPNGVGNTMTVAKLYRG